LEHCDINETGISGNTILHYAILDNKSDIIKQLLILGACLHLKNKFYKSPMDVAFHYLNYFTVKTIILYGNINVNIKNKMGDPLLTTIIKTFNFDLYRKKELVELLINKGVNVNSLDKNGHTPLYYAKRKNDYKNIYKLLKKMVHIKKYI